jgi:thiol-disulfide isomerase/thioredoxin
MNNLGGQMRVKSFIGACFFLFFSFAVVLAQQTVITGQLVGSDGKAMLKAHVGVKSTNLKKAPISLETDKDGNYKVEVKDKGMIMLEFIGVNHQRKVIPVYVEKDEEVKLNVKLAANNYKTDFTEVWLIENTQNSNPSKPKAFQKQADGTYVIEVESQKDHLEYQILGIDKNQHVVNGTQSEDYSYDGNGAYRSIVKVKDGKAKIVFDPTKLVRVSTKPEYSFVGGNPKLVAFAKTYESIRSRQEHLDSLVNEALNAGKDPNEVFATYSEKDQSDATKAKIAQEKDPFLRQLLILEYFTYFDQSEKDEKIALLAMDEIPVSSNIWALSPNLISGVIGSSNNKEKTKDYFDKFLAENPNDNLKANALLSAIQIATYSKKEEIAKNYLAILERDYPNSFAAKQAKLQFEADEIVKVGNLVPEFSVAAYGDSQKKYSRESMKGKYYLIDFWATWCKPCVGEMAALHKAYDKFKGSNFEILSFSFDNSPEDIATFREHKWKMPWLHAFVTDGFESQLARNFGVLGIPKPILVDPNGKIVAKEEDLRGESLEQTLSKVLSK